MFQNAQSIESEWICRSLQLPRLNTHRMVGSLISHVEGTHEGRNEMNAALSRIQEFVRSEAGPTSVEYAVMLTLIIGVCFIAIQSLGGVTRDVFQSLSDEFPGGA